MVLSNIASSAPSAMALRRVISALGGPIEMATTLKPYLSFRRRLSSSAWASKGLIMEGTPSLIRVPVTGSIFTWVVSGTCLMQVTINMFILSWKTKKINATEVTAAAHINNIDSLTDCQY